MAYRYDADYEEDSFSFKYTYNPLTGELTKKYGPNGVIKWDVQSLSVQMATQCMLQKHTTTTLTRDGTP